MTKRPKQRLPRCKFINPATASVQDFFNFMEGPESGSPLEPIDRSLDFLDALSVMELTEVIGEILQRLGSKLLEDDPVWYMKLNPDMAPDPYWGGTINLAGSYPFEGVIDPISRTNIPFHRYSESEFKSFPINQLPPLESNIDFVLHKVESLQEILVAFRRFPREDFSKLGFMSNSAESKTPRISSERKRLSREEFRYWKRRSLINKKKKVSS